jgi:hypothetical protein
MLRRWWVFPVVVIALLLGIVLTATSSRNLAKMNCDVNEGIWETRDSGLVWKCFNPNLIETDNNLRIIHANED